MKALFLAVALLTTGVSARASPCTQQMVDVLARQDVALREWQTLLNRLHDQVADLRQVVRALDGVKRGHDIAASLLSIAGKIKMVVDFIKSREAFATADRIERDFPDEAEEWRARGRRHRDAFEEASIQEVLGLVGMSEERIADVVVKGTVDYIRDDLQRETDALEAGLTEDYRALSASRRSWRQRHESCLPDLEVVPSPQQGRKPVAPSDSVQATAPKPRATVPSASLSPPTPIENASSKAVSGTHTATTSVPRRAPDLGTLDRMAQAPPQDPAVSIPSAPRHSLSQEAYLQACAGKETSAECHRVHCLHVGAALGDDKWTQRCLHGK